MALGTFGSTLSDELNRLANGGTYRTMASMVDDALAAKQWANRENINPYSTDTVGILNEIAGLGLDKKNWLDFNGVCNYIAGTTGLPAAAALRQVYPTTDLLTGVASYYIDATDASASTQTVTNLGTAGSLLPTTVGSSTSADSNDPVFLSHTGTNYVYLPGVSSNWLSVPDSSALDISGDLDIRLQVALDDWTPASISRLVSKYAASGQRSYMLDINTSGNLRLTWSADGTTLNTIPSTVATGIADGAVKWVRATLDVDNGASGNDIKFFTSDNGTTWTQLGTTITTAGVASIFNSTAGIGIGSDSVGTGTIAGKFYRAQIFNGIDGTKVLDVDTSVITAGSATSFTAVTGQTVTINRSTSGRKTVAVTQPTWLFGTDDYMEVNNRYMASGTYLYLPGVSSNYASAPDAAPLDITGDIDMRFKIALDDWTPATNNGLIAKDSNTTELAYRFVVLTTGLLRFSWSANGTTWNDISSTVAPTVTDGSTLWVRATFDVDNGASGNTVTFYTSTDGTTWTQLGDAVVTAGTTSIYSSNRLLVLGASGNGTGNMMRGKFFRAQVLNGIDGTVAFDANFETSITSLEQASFTESSANAATVTINRSGSAYRSAGITAAGYLYPGATNTFAASATDFFNFNVSQSVSLIAIFRQWATNTTFRGIVAKFAVPGSATFGYSIQTSNPSSTTIFSTSDGVTTGSSGGYASGLNELRMIGGVLDRTNNSFKTFTTTGELASASGTVPAYGIEYPIGNFTIGARGGGSSNVDGEICAVAFFRTALTSAQTRQIYNYFANREVYL